MWLATTHGFYSVVEHRDDPDHLLVRARVHQDLEALADQIPGIEPYETPEGDYRWRAEVTREQWRDAVAKLAMAIDYPNFKNAVDDRQGREREEIYSGVWAQLKTLQQRDT